MGRNSGDRNQHRFVLREEVIITREDFPFSCAKRPYELFHGIVEQFGRLFQIPT